jgi:hypothetical protein
MMTPLGDSHAALHTRVTWFDCLEPSCVSLQCAMASRKSSEKHRHVSITIRERLTSRTAVVSWSHSQLGCLAEQVWALGRAREADVCALSGEPIKRGDLVFRPRKTQPPAINERAVIAAHHILDAPVSD